MHTAVAADDMAVPINGAQSRNRFPQAALAAGAGLLACSIANALSRATEAPSPLIYWAGILIIAVPIFFRLTSQDASPGERLALVCLLGLALYGVKLVRDAPIFTFSDELIHTYNSNQISQHHDLFHSNPVLGISKYYPGLEGATSALRSLTGMSSFWAGAIVVGAARLTMMSAMFLLFWRVSGSARIAGLGAAIFTGNFNFLFWSAQFSYESLALPLLMLVLLATVETGVAPRLARRAWGATAAVAMAAVAVTHHISSYAMIAALSAISLAAALVRRTTSARPAIPWRLTLLAVAMTVFWLFVVASSTVGYLSPVLTDALDSTLHTLAGEAPARALFQGTTSTVGATPTLARAIALLAIILLAAGLPFGLRTAWRRYRTEPIALALALAAIGFFGALALRLAPEAWETGNRASEFLFIGLAFILACVGLERWRPETAPWLGRTLATASLAVILVGGAITGWPWDSHLALPLRVRSAEGPTISSPPLAAARWARDHVREGRFAAVTADARLLLDPGNKDVVTDYTADVVDTLPDPRLPPWAVPLLREFDVRFVVADQRVAANDGIRGYYFSEPDSPRNALLPRSAVTKFESVPNVSRVFDSGPIVVFDLAEPPKAEPGGGT